MFQTHDVTNNNNKTITGFHVGVKPIINFFKVFY